MVVSGWGGGVAEEVEMVVAGNERVVERKRSERRLRSGLKVGGRWR